MRIKSTPAKTAADQGQGCFVQAILTGLARKRRVKGIIQRGAGQWQKEVDELEQARKMAGRGKVSPLV